MEISEDISNGISIDIISQKFHNGLVRGFKVPANDGGISFGQVIITNEIIKESKSCVWQYR